MGRRPQKFEKHQTLPWMNVKAVINEQRKCSAGVTSPRTGYALKTDERTKHDLIMYVE